MLVSSKKVKSGLSKDSKEMCKYFKKYAKKLIKSPKKYREIHLKYNAECLSLNSINSILSDKEFINGWFKNKFDSSLEVKWGFSNSDYYNYFYFNITLI